MTALNAAEVTVTCDGEVVLLIANAISGGQASLGIRVQANAETFAVQAALSVRRAAWRGMSLPYHLNAQGDSPRNI